MTWSHQGHNSNDCPLPVEKGLLISHNGALYLYGGYCEMPHPDKIYSSKTKCDLDQTSHYQWQRGWSGSLNRFNYKSRYK